MGDYPERRGRRTIFGRVADLFRENQLITDEPPLEARSLTDKTPLVPKPKGRPRRDDVVGRMDQIVGKAISREEGNLAHARAQLKDLQHQWRASKQVLRATKIMVPFTVPEYYPTFGRQLIEDREDMMRGFFIGRHRKVGHRLFQ